MERTEQWVGAPPLGRPPQKPTSLSFHPAPQRPGTLSFNNIGVVSGGLCASPSLAISQLTIGYSPTGPITPNANKRKGNSLAFDESW